MEVENLIASEETLNYTLLHFMITDDNKTILYTWISMIVNYNKHNLLLKNAKYQLYKNSDSTKR